MTEKPSLFILTGASRGLGLSLARQLLQDGHRLLCISRHNAPDLAAHALATEGMSLAQWQYDLTDAHAAAERLVTWLQDAAGQVANATLINNAGAIPPVVPLAAAEADDTVRALRVGLEAPMLLTSAFLSATREWDVPRRVLNISSGLGRRAMASQAAYCTAKAGLDMMTRCAALEEASRPNGARLCSLAPGVIDTDMQRQLREADPAAFPDHGHFTALHSNTQLASPDDTAERILRFLARPDFGAEPIADIRD